MSVKGRECLYAYSGLQNSCYTIDTTVYELSDFCKNNVFTLVDMQVSIRANRNVYEVGRTFNSFCPLFMTWTAMLNDSKFV